MAEPAMVHSDGTVRHHVLFADWWVGYQALYPPQPPSASREREARRKAHRRLTLALRRVDEDGRPLRSSREARSGQR